MTEIERGTYEALRPIATEMKRPSVIFRPALTEKDGIWTATYGGVVATGETPFKAMYQFDWIWVRGHA